MCFALHDEVYAKEMRAPHCERIRKLIAEHGGHESGTAGDSFLIVFQSADDALACVAGIQQALDNPPITRKDDEGTEWVVRVRIGVHTARTQIRLNDHGEYVANDTNYASRVQSLGCGRQIVVSDAAVSAAGSASRYHWAHWPNRRLKSFSTPELVHELLWRGKDTSLGEPGSRWVPEWFKGEQNRYVPRKALENDILAAFDQSDSSGAPNRLVTLHAGGGMGKTRLSIACAIKAAGFFEKVYFIPLEDAPQPGVEWLVDRLAQTLKLAGLAATADGIVRYLEERRYLVVLDNYESVDCDASAEFIRRLLVGTKQLRLLVTGREAVRIQNIERLIQLNDGLTSAESQNLFIERAALRKTRGWKPSADELNVIDQITIKLEHQPLSIELVAVWIEQYTVIEVIAELEKALLGPITAIPPRWRSSDPAIRHHSLQACLNWSWNLLESKYHDGFASLSLFADSFDIQSVTGACGVADAKDLLHRLHNAALLKRIESTGASRYSMLRSVQSFARQKFDAFTDRAPRVQLFVEHYVQLASENTDVNDDAMRDVLDREWRNAAGATVLAENTTLWSAAVSISCSLTEFLRMRGEYPVCESLLYRELRAAVALKKPKIGVRASFNLGVILLNRDDFKGAEAIFKNLLKLVKKLGDLFGTASAYKNLGDCLSLRNDRDRAETMYRESLLLFQKIGDLDGMAAIYGRLGAILQTRGDLKGAEAMHLKSLEIFEKLGKLGGLAKAYGQRGTNLSDRGDTSGADSMFRKSLAIYITLGDLAGIAAQYVNIGTILENRGNRLRKSRCCVGNPWRSGWGRGDVPQIIGNFRKTRSARWHGPPVCQPWLHPGFAGRTGRGRADVSQISGD